MGRFPVFLTAKQIVRLYRTRIMAAMPTQPPLLESAVSSPVNQHHYTRTDDVFYLAAVLAQKVMLNHSFSDGNKRTSVAAADVFLRLNGYQLTQADDPFLAEREDSVYENEDLSKTTHPTSLADAHVAVASGVWNEKKAGALLSENSTAFGKDLADCGTVSVGIWTSGRMKPPWFLLWCSRRSNLPPYQRRPLGVQHLQHQGRFQLQSSQKTSSTRRHAGSSLWLGISWLG